MKICLCLGLIFVTLSNASLAELTREKRQAPSFVVEPWVRDREAGVKGTYSSGGSRLTGNLGIDAKGFSGAGLSGSHKFGSTSIGGNIGHDRRGTFGGLGGSTSFGQNKVSGSWNRGPSGSDNYGVDYSRSFDNNRGSVGASFSRSGGSNSFGLNLKYRFRRATNECTYVYCFISPCQYMDCAAGSVCVRDRCSCNAQCQPEPSKPGFILTV